MVNPSRQNKKALLGKKLGMTQVYRENGSVVPVTVIQAGPCSILQVKTVENDGYAACKLGFDPTGKKAIRPMQGIFDAAQSAPLRFIREVPPVAASDLLGAGDDAAAEVKAGARIGVGVFREVKRVDVQGLTKGRGFAGTIKRWGFNRGRAGHGSKNTREPGSTGQHTDPGRVFKGKHMPGHFGHSKRKVRNLEVVKLDEDKNLLVVKGAVPGPNGAYVYIEESLLQP